MKRLCFLSPDLEHARKVVADLRNNGIEEQHIYVLARHGVDMEDLPDAGPEADDFMAGYKRGLTLGGSAGVLAGLTALAFPPAGIVIGGGFVLLTGLFGAAFPSSRLQEFEQAIEDGNILIMVDVPASEVGVFETLIKDLDPAVSVEGIEPPAKLIP